MTVKEIAKETTKKLMNYFIDRVFDAGKYGIILRMFLSFGLLGSGGLYLTKYVVDESNTVLERQIAELKEIINNPPHSFKRVEEDIAWGHLLDMSKKCGRGYFVSKASVINGEKNYLRFWDVVGFDGHSFGSIKHKDNANPLYFESLEIDGNSMEYFTKYQNTPTCLTPQEATSQGLGLVISIIQRLRVNVREVCIVPSFLHNKPDFILIFTKGGYFVNELSVCKDNEIYYLENLKTKIEDSWRNKTVL